MAATGSKATGVLSTGGIAAAAAVATGAGTTFKLPKQYHPDFSAPGKQPLGAIEIDWNNPISKALWGVYVFNDGNRGLRDLVDGTWATSVNGGADRISGYRQGRGLNFNDLPDDRLILNKGSLGTRAISILTSQSFNDVTVDNALLDVNNQNFVIWGDTNSSQIRTQIFSGSSVAGANGGLATSNDINKFRNWGCTVRPSGSSNRVVTFVDGEIHVADTSAGSTNFSTSSNIAIGANYSNTGKESDGAMQFVFIWTRTLTTAEFRSVSLDPYQILKPAVPLMYFTAGATEEEVTSESSAYPLPKRYHPDFSNPYRAPTGGIEVDWSSPFTQDLVIATIPSQGDLVTGAPAIPLGGDALIKPVAVSGTPPIPPLQARAFSYLADNSRHEMAVRNDISTTALTVMTVFRSNGHVGQGSSINAIFGKTTSFNASYRTTSVTAAIGSSYSYTTTDHLDGNWHELTAIRYNDGSARTKVYFDGVNRGNNSGGSPAQSTDPLQIGTTDTNNDRNISGDVAFVLVWNRILSDEEMAMIRSQGYFYPLFRPTTPMMYFTAGGEVVTPAGVMTFEYYLQLLANGGII